MRCAPHIRKHKILLYQLLKDPIQLILVLPCILVSLTFHEWAHGYAAYKCGDMTAKMYGRLSLNPLAHLDPVGSVCMLLFGFGWAKPVPVNTRNFRHPKRDFAIVAIAGPLMNLLLAFGGAGVSTLVWYAGQSLIINYQMQLDTGFISGIVYYTYLLFSLFCLLNIGLAVFNLIPVPPLDGSRIVSWLLPPKASAKYNRIELYTRYILLALVVLTWLPAPLSNIVDWVFFPVDWLRGVLVNAFTGFWDLIFGLIWKL